MFRSQTEKRVAENIGYTCGLFLAQSNPSQRALCSPLDIRCFCSQFFASSIMMVAAVPTCTSQRNSDRTMSTTNLVSHNAGPPRSLAGLVGYRPGQLWHMRFCGPLLWQRHGKGDAPPACIGTCGRQMTAKLRQGNEHRRMCRSCRGKLKRVCYRRSSIRSPSLVACVISDLPQAPGRPPVAYGDASESVKRARVAAAAVAVVWRRE